MSAKRYYPAFLDLAGRLVVVVGPAQGLLKKANQLAKYGADVTVITPAPEEELLQAEARGVFGVEARAYVRGDLNGAALVLCLAEDDEVRKAVRAEALQVGCPVSVAGSARDSSFLAPSVVHREPLQIAVSTGGVAPELAKYVRRRLAAEYGEEWSAFSGLFGTVRVLALEQLDDPAQVDALLTSLIESDVLDRIRAGEDLSAEAVYQRFAPPAEEPSSAGGEEQSPV